MPPISPRSHMCFHFYAREGGGEKVLVVPSIPLGPYTCCHSHTSGGISGAANSPWTLIRICRYL